MICWRWNVDASSLNKALSIHFSTYNVCRDYFQDHWKSVTTEAIESMISVAFLDFKLSRLCKIVKINRGKVMPGQLEVL